MSLSDVEPLDSPQYVELMSITRSLHLRSAMASCGKQRLVSHKIQTRNVKVKAKVLWFAPTKPMNQNNMYGNVSFTLDWSRAVDLLGPKLYYIDQQATANIIYSRVLLTNTYHNNLTPVNTNDLRMPLKKLGGKYHVATVCDGVTHVLEIGIEADAKRGKWLFANCKIQANDHSSANQLQYSNGTCKPPCNCHRFNYFEKVCPSSYTEHQTKAILNKKFPLMLRDGPSWNHAQVVLESSGTLHQETHGADEDGDDYEDGKFIANYDDHVNTIRQVSWRRPTGFPGGHGRTPTRDDSSDDESYGNARASGFQRMATRHEQDEGWSTGGKVALVAGGLALFAGLAAAFTAVSKEEDKRKETKQLGGMK